jgi:hypothetical protein
MMTGVLNRKAQRASGYPCVYVLFNHGCTHYSGSALRRRRRAGTRGAGQSALSSLDTRVEVFFGVSARPRVPR